MAVRKSKLYSAFGEVIYAIAMADGKVHEEEVTALKNLLANHDWARGVSWSFDYENKQNRKLDEIMTYATRVFKENGPCEEYSFFIDVVEKIAEAHDGIVPEEQKLIDRLKQDLRPI